MGSASSHEALSSWVKLQDSAGAGCLAGDRGDADRVVARWRGRGVEADRGGGGRGPRLQRGVSHAHGAEHDGSARGREDREVVNDSAHALAASVEARVGREAVTHGSLDSAIGVVEADSQGFACQRHNRDLHNLLRVSVHAPRRRNDGERRQPRVREVQHHVASLSVVAEFGHDLAHRAQDGEVFDRQIDDSWKHS
eukprot:3933885-Rhodomonas_salina.1